MIKSAAVGDTVEMISNLGKELRAMPKPRLGTVTHVDGEYIMVKPNGKDWVQEFYRNELKKPKNKP